MDNTLVLRSSQVKAIEELKNPKKHIVLAPCGVGKTAISLAWLKNTGKKKWLFITVPSKVKSHDVENEAVAWFGEEFVSSLSSFVVLSWGKLYRWVAEHYDELDDYAIVGDEIQKMRRGISSQRGTAFLEIAKKTPIWTGYTATPGDNWEAFMGYFVAVGYCKNKTQFVRDHCIYTRYKGFPELQGYRNVEEMRAWWAEMTVVPDVSEILAELPSERHYTLTFAPDPYYKTCFKTHMKRDGELAETTAAWTSELRRLCFGKDKQQWLTDYLEGLGQPTVLFYWFVETGDKLVELAKKALPKTAKVWRICGGVKDIPTRETIGKDDVVICQWTAGSESLNLQFISEWVSIEPAYAYDVSDQARGRIRRIGQDHKMRFHYLMCPHTIEEDIYAVLKKKGEFSEQEWARKTSES